MRRLCVILILCLSLQAEVRMNVDQLRSFVASSKKLGHTDKQIADYVKNIRMTERLDESTIEDIGAGPKTAEALRKLIEPSKALAQPKPPEPKPVAQPIPPPDSVEQARVLDQARAYAREYSRSLPNFICTQVTRRYIDPSGLEFWQSQDTVVSRLSFFEQKEDYKVVLVNNRVVDTTMDRLGGTTTSGEFGSMMKELFDSKTQARFEWERWATLRGKRMHVFSYRVEQPNSKYAIVVEKRDGIIAGYTGLVYVDKETDAIMRLTQEVTEVPAGFPVTYVRNVLDYDYAEIAGQQFILPLKASTLSRMGKIMTKNDTEFRLYKKFGAEATITFAPDALPESELKEEPVKP